MRLSILGFIGLLFLIGCTEPSYEESREKRASLAAKSADDIVIGVSWTLEDDFFLEGVKLAVKEINEAGGIFDRQFKLLIDTDETKILDKTLSFEERQHIILKIADSFVKNPNVVAVVGHSTSDVAILASVVYQSHGILYLAPSATNKKLTGHLFDFVFRTIPNNSEVATQAANYAAQRGYKKFAVLRTRGDYETELVDTFSAQVSRKTEDNIERKIIFRRSFFAETLDIPELLVHLKRLKELDAIFIATSGELTEKIYQQSRDMGLRVPFIGGETLDTRAFLRLVEQWEYPNKFKKSIIPTVFNASIKKAQIQKFLQNFSLEYGEDKHPDYLAALGYDTIKVLAHAMKRANSSVPFRVADALRYMPPCLGVTGDYSFKANGDLQSKPIYFKSLIQHSYKYEQIVPEGWDENKKIGECNNIDYDYDSIPDDLDACRYNTKQELAKGIYLTGLSRGCPIDTDEDKVADYKDKCPENTAQEISKGVDEAGCPIDTDGDKTPDYQDACPANPELITFVDGKNCSEDSDKDEMMDDLDLCPKNAVKELVYGINLTGDKRGCPIDTDQDLVPDYRDNCPNNNKLELSFGVNPQGCSMDKDLDTIVDYKDKCLETPINALIDENGCEVLEYSIKTEASDVYFDVGKSVLTRKGKQRIKTILSWIDTPLFVKISFRVHTDTSGRKEANQKLSEERAMNIGTYLQQQGIKEKEIGFEGWGDKTPVSSNETKQGREQNRRIEFFIMHYRHKSQAVEFLKKIPDKNIESIQQTTGE